MIDTLLFVAVSLLSSAAPPEVSDWIRLEDGNELRGRIVHAGKKVHRIQKGRGELEIARTNVADWRSAERRLAELLQRAERVSRSDVAARGDLARLAAERGLHQEARNSWLRVLMLDEPFFALLRDAWHGRRIEKDFVKTFGGTPEGLGTALHSHAEAHAH